MPRLTASAFRRAVTKGTITKRAVATLWLVAVAVLSGCNSMPSSTASNVNATVAVTPVIPVSLQNGYSAAIQQLRNNKLDQSYNSFQLLVTQYPTYSGPYINLGLIHLRWDQTDKAETHFKKAVSVNPDSFSGHNQLAILYRKKGMFTGAESHYLAAKRLKPNNPDVHRNLGILYDLYMGKLPEALSLYEQYGALMDTPHPALKGWIIDIKHRIKTQTKHLETALTER